MSLTMKEGTTPAAAPQPRPARGAAVWLAWAVALLVALAPLFSSNPYYVHLAVIVCLNVVTVSGLFILMRAGQLSLCHAAFIGLGAYTSVLVSSSFGLPFVAATIVGVAAAALLAYVLGSIILRLRGTYFVLITFAFGELFRLCLLQLDFLTGGANGISGIPAAAILGFVFDSKKSFYCIALLLAIGALLFLALLFKLPKGHALDAVGDNPDLAEASGLSVRKTQLFAFVAGSVLAALGGAFLARYVGYISPESFNSQTSIAVVIMLVVGGRQSILGPLVGALMMTLLPELLRGAVQMQNIIYAVILILMLRFMPQGLAGGLGRLLALRRRPRSAS
jgi:branched-chain amino acid transport system permease protein